MKAILRYPGSKWRIAKWIISHFPPHKSYLEPFLGSGAVLLNKPPSAIETVNDLSGDITNLFKVLRERPEELSRVIEMTPYSREEYEMAWRGIATDDVEKARLFCVKSLQSHGFRTRTKTGWKNDVIGREKAYGVRHWNDMPKLIVEASLRLKQVQIECMDAIELIKRFNYEGVLIYVDPPYLLQTRARKQYEHEMTSVEEHQKLLETLLNHKGTVVISGYDNDLYNSYLRSWTKAHIQSNAEKGRHRIETIWMNFHPSGAKDEIS